MPQITAMLASARGPRGPRRAPGARDCAAQVRPVARYRRRVAAERSSPRKPSPCPRRQPGYTRRRLPGPGRMATASYRRGHRSGRAARASRSPAHRPDRIHPRRDEHPDSGPGHPAASPASCATWAVTPRDHSRPGETGSKCHRAPALLAPGPVSAEPSAADDP
jgi:hypothetical protein